MRTVIATAFLLLITAAASAAEFSSLEERMSQAQFHAAGLDKLSPEELKVLNDWVRSAFQRHHHNSGHAVRQARILPE